MNNEEEGVSYIEYMDDDDKLTIWKVSTVTKIAQQIPRAESEPIYPRNVVEKSNRLDIKYITEYLKEQGFYEFEREGDLVFFKDYYTKGEGTIMHTKSCSKCCKEYIINVDETHCLLCK